MKCLNCAEVIHDLSSSCGGCGVYLPSLLKDFLPVGQSLHQQKYKVLAPLGRGGFGLTYTAEQKLLKHKVALKEYFPQSLTHRNANTHTLSYSPQSQGSFSRGLERFLREGRILAQLKHPHIVNVLDLFEENGTAYLVMEYLEGDTLKAHLESKKKLPPAQVQTWGSELVSALGAVHAQGVYHLDIKPDNILLVADAVKLIDFGAAKPENSYSQSTRSFTLQYAAPEVLSNGEVGAWSDIFELGMLLYEMLQGEVPPDALSRLLNANWQVDGCGEPWNQLLSEALAIQPAQRPRDIGAWWNRHFEAISSAKVEVVSKDEKECPYCAEVIKAKAIVCRYCNRELSSTSPLSESRPASPVSSAPTPAVRNQPAKIRNSLGMDFVLIQPGSFTMGSPTSETWRFSDETQHDVTLTKGFYLQNTPVTQSQWQAVMGTNPSHFKGADRPVENVSWKDCQQFIYKLNTQGLEKYRLPTEAEWEYACRAGSPSAYYYGDDLGKLGEYAWIRENSDSGTHPVGNKKPNAWDLYDMHGNVWEWCQNWHGKYPTKWEIDPQGPSHGVNRVLRGGSWYGVASNARCAKRLSFFPDSRYFYLGFRLLRLL